MIETASFLHNMSSLPRSVVSYEGLANEPKSDDPMEVGFPGNDPQLRGVFGTFIGFRLQQSLCHSEPDSILKELELDTVGAPMETLLNLIENRAKELPLPDACVVVPANPVHICPWPDPLAALAVITKSSDNVWLRHKSPRVSILRRKRSISLLVPPTFAERLGELSK